VVRVSALRVNLQMRVFGNFEGSLVPARGNRMAAEIAGALDEAAHPTNRLPLELLRHGTPQSKSDVQ
jgi:hypothetical protein